MNKWESSMIRKAIIDTERSNIQTLQRQASACNGLTPSQDLLPDDIFKSGIINIAMTRNKNSFKAASEN